MKAAASRTWSGSDSAYRDLLDYASQNSRREQERSLRLLRRKLSAALCSRTTLPRIPREPRRLPRADVSAVAPRAWVVFHSVRVRSEFRSPGMLPNVQNSFMYFCIFSSQPCIQGVLPEHNASDLVNLVDYKSRNLLWSGLFLKAGEPPWDSQYLDSRYSLLDSQPELILYC